MSDGSDAKTYRYSLVERREDNEPTEHESTLAELAEHLREHGRTVDTKNGPGFLPASFENGRRANEDVECVHWLALDIEDTDGTVDALHGPLTSYQRIVYSTWSHGDPAKWTEGEPRFRVLVPLETPVAPEAYRALWQHVYELLDGAPDAGCKDPARLMYTPRRRNPEATIDPWLELHEDGPALDPEALPAGDGETVSADRLVARQRARQCKDTPFEPPKSLEDAEWVTDALEYIDPDIERDQWRNVGIALKAAFGDDAFEPFDTWSAKGGKYEWHDTPLGCRGQWDSFPHDDPDQVAGDGVTLGTIIHLAKENGWTPPPNAFPRVGRPVEGMLDPFEGTEPIELEDGRAKLRDATRGAIRSDRARLHVVATPGSGKTYATLDELAQAVLEGAVESFKVQLPTNDVLEEKKRAFLERVRDHANSTLEAKTVANNTAIRPKRTADSCPRLDALQAFERTREGGGREFCQGCGLHLDNVDDRERACGYTRERAERLGNAFEFTTHALDVLQRGDLAHEDDGAPKREIAWTRILRAFLDAAARPQTTVDGTNAERFVGRLERTRKLERLTVVADNDGTTPPSLVEGQHFELEGGTPRVTTEGQLEIRRWLAESTPVTERRTELFGYYRREAADAEIDVLVIDETPTGAMCGTVEAALGDFQAWAQNEDLDGPDGWFETVVQALGTDTYHPHHLSEALPENLTCTGNTTGEKALNEALELPGDRDRARRAERAPDWRALEAVEWASRNGWKGCRIHEGTLILPRPRNVDTAQADSVLYLDATGDPSTAQTVLGSGYDECIVQIELPESTTVQQVDWQYGKYPDGKDLARAEFLFSDSFCGDSHLHVTRKAMNPGVDFEERHDRDDSAEVVAERERHIEAARRRLELDEGDHVVHVAGTQTRGSNAFEGCNSVTVASFYVPGGAIYQRAAQLAMLEGTDLEERHKRAAVWQLEGAEIYQAAHRTRPVDGDVCVTYCDERTIPGLDPDREFDRETFDLAAAMATGEFHNWKTCDPAAALLRAWVLEQGGTAWATPPEALNLDPGISHYTVTLHKDPLWRSTVYREMADQWRTRAKQCVAAAWRNRWEGSWSKAADAAGLEAFRIEHSDGGSGRHVLAAGEPGAIDLRAFVESSDVPEQCGWQWCELPDGERIEFTTPPADELRGALAELGDVEAFPELAAAEKRNRIGDALDVSASTVYRRMNAADWSTDDLDRIWRDLHEASTPENPLDGVELEHGDILLPLGPDGCTKPAPFKGEPREQAVREYLEERAAIMEYHGELSREQAESKARHHTWGRLYAQAKRAHDQNEHPHRILHLYDQFSQKLPFDELPFLPTYETFAERLWFVREEFHQHGVDTERYDAPIGRWDGEFWHWSECYEWEIETWGTSEGIRRHFQERTEEFHQAHYHDRVVAPDVPRYLVQRVCYVREDDEPPHGENDVELAALQGEIEEYAPRWDEPGPTHFELKRMKDLTSRSLGAKLRVQFGDPTSADVSGAFAD